MSTIRFGVERVSEFISNNQLFRYWARIMRPFDSGEIFSIHTFGMYWGPD